MTAGVWNSVLIASAWLLGVAAFAFVLWCLVWDRPRGRRRCPKCWYDMSGAEARDSLVCPECGKRATSERMLQRTRRRWKISLLGALPMSMAVYLLLLSNAASKEGWPAALPTTALILLAPEDELSAWFQAGMPSPYAIAARNATGPGNAWVAEIWERRHRLAPRHARLVAQRTRSNRDGHVVRAYDLSGLVALWPVQDDPTGYESLFLARDAGERASYAVIKAHLPPVTLVERIHLGTSMLVAAPERTHADIVSLLELLGEDPRSYPLVELSDGATGALVPALNDDEEWSVFDRAGGRLRSYVECRDRELVVGDPEWIRGFLERVRMVKGSG